jgi:hypothetical protein
VGFVSTTGTPFLTINNPQQTLAFIQQGLSSRASVSLTANLPHCQSHNSPLPSNPMPDAIVNFSGDSSIFTRRSFVPNGDPTQAASPQNVPGFGYKTTSGFNNSQAGAPSSFGTRIEAIFNNVPQGVGLRVPNVSNNGGNQLTLTRDPLAPFSPVTAINGWAQVPIEQGIGSVTYEVTGNAPGGTFNGYIPIVTSFTSNGLISGSPTPGPITVEITARPN